MAELALDLDRAPHEVISVLPERWDYLVTFRSLREAALPEGHGGHVVRWECADPALYAGTRAHLIEAYRAARDEVRLLVADFIVALEGRP